MNKYVLSGLAASLLLFSGCSDTTKKEEQTEKTEAAEKAQKTASSQEQSMPSASIFGVENVEKAPQQDAMMAQKQASALHVGNVVETMNAAGYTYAKVDEKGNVYWIAGPETAAVKPGDTISFLEQMWMTDFQSKSLNKSFDKIMFVSTIAPSGAKVAPKESGMPAAAAAAAPAPTEPIAKAAGEFTIEELYAKRAELAGKQVSIKGKVVKLSRGIMGKDWVHLQDGTGEEGSDDLVVTTLSADVSEGEVVTATGTVKTDVSLGYGYNYALLVENSTFSK